MSSSYEHYHKSNANPTTSWFPAWLSWRPTSELLLYIAEKKMLHNLRSAFESFYVPILKSKYIIRTLFAFDEDQIDCPEYKERIPIVLVHGMGAGVGMWCKNFDDLTKNRRVFSFDLLGFARSSRPSDMSSAMSSEEAEDLFINSIEEWRCNLNLDKFILLGHSLGGFLSYSYAIQHPDKIKHLILVDPWGFPEYNPDAISRRFGLLFKIVKLILGPFDPLMILRSTGPLGPVLLRKFRKDLGVTFNEGFKRDVAADMKHETENFRELHEIDDEYDFIFDYVYHCNSQKPASGEGAFKALSQPIGWAKYPMLKRVEQLDDSVPVTFIYGGRSWMNSDSGNITKDARGRAETDVYVLEGAGHHVYAQKASEFNALVNDICSSEDARK